MATIVWVTDTKQPGLTGNMNHARYDESITCRPKQFRLAITDYFRLLLTIQEFY